MDACYARPSIVTTPTAANFEELIISARLGWEVNRITVARMDVAKCFSGLGNTHGIHLGDPICYC